MPPRATTKTTAAGIIQARAAPSAGCPGEVGAGAAAVGATPGPTGVASGTGGGITDAGTGNMTSAYLLKWVSMETVQPFPSSSVSQRCSISVHSPGPTR